MQSNNCSIHMELGFQVRGGWSIRKKKLQKGIHIVLTNYKYIKSLFLNTLRCNHFPTKRKKKYNFF